MKPLKFRRLHAFFGPLAHRSLVGNLFATRRQCNAGFDSLGSCSFFFPLQHVKSESNFDWTYGPNVV